MVSYTRMEIAIRELTQTDKEQGEQLKFIQNSCNQNYKELTTHHDIDIKTLHAEIRSNEVQFQKIEVSIEGIKTTQEFMKEQLRTLLSKQK